MREYLANILPRIQSESKKLDHIEAFVHKPWVMMEEGSNELLEYEFYRDGRLLVSKGGDVSWGNWELTPSSQRLLLTYSDKTLMMHNAFINDALMVLKRSGTTNPSVVFVNPKVIEDLNYRRYLDELNQKKEQELLRQNRELLFNQEKDRLGVEKRQKLISAITTFCNVLNAITLSLVISCTVSVVFGGLLQLDLESYDVYLAQAGLSKYNYDLNQYSYNIVLLSLSLGFVIFLISLIYNTKEVKPTLRDFLAINKPTVVFVICLLLTLVLALLNRYEYKKEIEEIISQKEVLLQP